MTFNRWRKNMLPPSKNDIEWRHNELASKIDQLSSSSADIERHNDLASKIDKVVQRLGLAGSGHYIPSKATFVASPDELSEIIGESGAILDQRSLNQLMEMYRDDAKVIIKSGETVALDKDTRISIEQGLLLHSLITKNNVSKSLEIGFAFGFSTIWILEALRGHMNAQHVAVDPGEKTVWKSVGLTQVEKIGFEGDFRWIEDFSIHALSDAIRRNEEFDFIYIDGNHRFDDVVVDFYLCDQALREGGIIVLDDMWMRSIRTAASFITMNRFYCREETSVSNVAVFRKLANDRTRAWDHFVPFEVAEGA